MSAEAAAPGSTVEQVWARHLRYNRIAGRSRARLDASRRANLVLLGLGALFGAIAAQDGMPDSLKAVAGGLASLVLLLAGSIQRRALSGALARRWTTARAASEAAKADVFRYLAGTAPYDQADRDDRLADASEQIADDARTLDEVLVDIAPQGPRLPAVHDLSSYTTVRAVEQADWHAGKIHEHRRTAARLRLIELAATLAAALITAIGAITGVGDLGLWVGVATTIGAAVAAHIDADAPRPDRRPLRHDRAASPRPHLAPRA